MVSTADNPIDLDQDDSSLHASRTFTTKQRLVPLPTFTIRYPMKLDVSSIKFNPHFSFKLADLKGDFNLALRKEKHLVDSSLDIFSKPVIR